MGPDLSGGWRTLHASVAGRSHAAAGRPCEDSGGARVLALADGTPLLLGLVADGAGEAALGGEGARLACQCVDDIVAGWATRNLRLDALQEDAVRDWIVDVRDRLDGVARLSRVELQELATTLVVALVDPWQAVFLQVGDGAVAYRDGCGGYQAPIRPQSGQYANSTCFVTDPLSAEHMLFARASGVDELALFSDGLQNLALQLSAWAVHAPFLSPMFERLRGVATAGLTVLDEALRGFLDGPAVNARSDDDKTLVLATRLRADRRKPDE